MAWTKSGVRGVNRRKGLAMLAATVFLGVGSLPLFLLFLYFGPFGAVDLHLGRTQALLFDAGLCLAFFVQHSGMVRRSFRLRLARLVREEYHAAFFSAASGAVLLALVLLWQESGWVVAAPGGALRLVWRAFFFFALAGFAWGARALGPFDTFGIRAVVRHLRGREPPSIPFTVRGPYRFVRHPLYLFSLVMIWSCPDLTADRLLFNVLWTAWVAVGARLEERDLVAAYGDDYRAYQRRVPMLLPFSISDRSISDRSISDRVANREFPP